MRKETKKALIIANTAGLITDFLSIDCSLLRDMGYSIDCLCNSEYPGMDSPAFFDKYDITVFDAPFPIRSLDLASMKVCFCIVARLLKSGQYDLVHCHSTIAAAIARIAAKQYRKNGLKVIYTSHGLPFYQGSSGYTNHIYHLIEAHLSKHTDAVVAICLEDFKNMSKMSCGAVYHIPGVGIDTDSFEHCECDPGRKKQELGVPDEAVVILSIGELNSNKNHEVIIRTLAAGNFDDCVYLICGREVTEKGKGAELKKLAHSLGVNVELLGYRSDIPEICRCADIGALPSFKEGLGLSGVEMLASGVPLIGSNRQGIKDYVVDGVTGYLFDPESTEDAMRALTILKEELSSSNSYRDSCIEMARRFDRAESYRAMKKMYEETLTNRNGN